MPICLFIIKSFRGALPPWLPYQGFALDPLGALRGPQTPRPIILHPPFLIPGYGPGYACIIIGSIYVTRHTPPVEPWLANKKMYIHVLVKLMLKISIGFFGVEIYVSQCQVVMTDEVQ